MREGANIFIRFWLEVDLEFCARKEVAKAARRIPKMAPRVPPISSTASMIECSTENIDPDFAAPLSKILRIARLEHMVSFGHGERTRNKPSLTPLTASPQSPSPITISHFVKLGSATMARSQASRIVASKSLGSTIKSISAMTKSMQKHSLYF